MHTPWGTSQQQKKIADGITSYSTASHGGYQVSAERLAEMPDCIREFKTYAGTGWYEEDCDWCLVVLSFPSLFDGRSCHYAIKTLKMSTSDYFKDLAAAYWKTPQAIAAQDSANLFERENADKYAQSGFGSKGNGAYITAYHMTTNERIVVLWTSGRSENTWMKLPEHFTIAEAEALGATIERR